jgi:hypothetical protein
MHCSTVKVGRGHCPQHVSRARGNTALQNTDSTYVQHSHIITVTVLSCTGRTNIIWLAPFSTLQRKCSQVPLKTEPVECGVWMHNLLFTPFCVCLFSAFITFWLHIFHFALFICLFFPLFRASFNLSYLFLFYFPSLLLPFLVAFACKKRLLASSCLSVSPSVCPQGTTPPPKDGFSWNLVKNIFRKPVEKNKNFIKSWQE